MQFDPRDGFRPDDHGRAGRAGNSPKAANGISSAKAGLPGPALDRQPDLHTLISPPARSPRLELSLTQILGSTAAAVTAAFLGSRLGVAGTLIGAALASVISVVGGALYTTSLKATRQQVAKVLVGRSDTDGADGQDGAGATPVRPGPPLGPAVLPAAVRPPGRPAGSSGAPARRPRPALRGAFVGALLSAVVFVGALLVVTGVESVTGTALSGGSAGSLTILGGNDSQRVGDRRDTPTSTPTTSGAGTSTPAASSSGAATSGTAAPNTSPTTSGAANSPAPATTTPSSTGSATPSTSTSQGGQTSTDSSSESTTGAQEPVGSTPATTAPATSAPASSAPNSTGGTTSPTTNSSSTSGRPAPGALIVG